MSNSRFLTELASLKKAAIDRNMNLDSGYLTEWKNKVRSVLTLTLEPTDHLIKSFDEIHYTPSIWTSDSPDSYFERIRQSGVNNACGVIESAIYKISLVDEQCKSVLHQDYDPELWDHVRKLVDESDWAKIASQVAIFVESKVRDWANDPRDEKGNRLVGQALYAKALGKGGLLCLGSQDAETQGWMHLGIGLAMACGNVDRHRIQKRDDVRAYALGVLGLGSLLLTQLKFEKPDLA